MGKIIIPGSAEWSGLHKKREWAKPLRRHLPDYLLPLNPSVDEFTRDLNRMSIQHFADGLFYWDTREPFMAADQSTVTLSTTAKALYTVSAFPVLGGQYFSRIGKKLRIRCFGKITNDGTAGNGNFAVYYGTGADANGVLLVSSTAVALTVSQTNLSWMCEIFVHARSLGSTGTLFCIGKADFNEAILAARQMIPASAAVVSGACDLTAALIISIQYLRSGAGVYTMTVQDMEVVAMN